MTVQALTRIVKRTVAITVCAAIVQSPLNFVRADDEAENREPASIKPVTFLSEDQEKAIRNGVFDTAVATSKMVKSHKDYERYLLSGVAASDRAILSERLATVPLGKLPKFRNENGELVGEYHAGTERMKIRIRWPDVHKTIYEVNGVQFVYNPGKPLVPQLDYLLEKLKARKVVSTLGLFEETAGAEDESALLGPLSKVTEHVTASDAASAAKSATVAIDAAEAATKAAKETKLLSRLRARLPKVTPGQVLIATAGVTFLPKMYDQGGSVILNGLNTGYCMVVDSAGAVGWMGQCVDWKKAQYDKKKLASPNGALTKEPAVMARFEFDHIASCPDNEDGKPRVLAGQIRAIAFDNDKTSYTGKWENIRAVWNANLSPQSLVVVPEDVDPSKPITDPVKQHHVTMSLSFDKDGFLTGTTVPNTAWNPEDSDVLTGPTKTLSPDKVMTAEESAQFEKSKDVLFITLTYARKCIVAKAQALVKDGNSPIKAPPGSAGATTGPVPSVAPVPAVVQ